MKLYDHELNVHVRINSDSLMAKLEKICVKNLLSLIGMATINNYLIVI